MVKIVILVLTMLAGTSMANATLYKIIGNVADSATSPISAASVSLLYPGDSTLALFSITNPKGGFVIHDVKEGEYLLQIAMMGFYTVYKRVTVPSQELTNMDIRMETNIESNLLQEVIISGEKVPVRVKGDTLEYNAGSYKVKPNAVVEDLLRKLPGVEVDKEGNIKSMGKEVRKVLVDGKEFFGDDPKVATKNLPADAVDRIQAFEKKSDQSLFSGIDDGQREQTLNVLLKDGKKTGHFGEIAGGLGLPEQYDASAKLFKFRKKTQLAGMGMLNNINKFGFSFQDYLNYSGGINSLLRGGSMTLNADEVPVDFGQPVTGKVMPGAMAVNYSIEPNPKKRFDVSYMGNGVRKFLDQYTYSRNFLPGGDFEKKDESERRQHNLNNRVATSWRNQIDTSNMITMSAYGKLGTRQDKDQMLSESYNAASLQNRLLTDQLSRNHSSGAGGSANWVGKMKGKWQLMQGSVYADYGKGSSNSQWQNIADYIALGTSVRDNQYQDNDEETLKAGASFSATRKIGQGLFFEPALTASWDKELNNRFQGRNYGDKSPVDSLSPQFYRNVMRLAPGISFKRLFKSNQLILGLKGEALWLTPFLGQQQQGQTRKFAYLLPSVLWQKDIKGGERLSFRYNTQATAPMAGQLLPIVNYSNPLMRTVGNIKLKPEYAHSASVDYNIFDQFSMSSFFASIRGSYTEDKISWARTVNSDLSQDMKWVNTKDATQASANVGYSRPVRKLGVSFNASLTETWNRTLNPVNGVDNINNTLNHEGKLSFNNIKNDIFEVRAGGTVRITNAYYSLNKELNNDYFNYSGFAQLNYIPTEAWYLSVEAEVTHYTARTFDAPITVPILKAELSRYVLANQRGTVTLRGYDLLNRNKAIQRSSQLNSLTEQQSNVIGRYVMLSFAYKLNRGGKKGAPGGVEVRMQ